MFLRSMCLDRKRESTKYIHMSTEENATLRRKINAYEISKMKHRSPILVFRTAFIEDMEYFSGAVFRHALGPHD